jgi:hypothetical protein
VVDTDRTVTNVCCIESVGRYAFQKDIVRTAICCVIQPFDSFQLVSIKHSNPVVVLEGMSSSAESTRMEICRRSVTPFPCSSVACGLLHYKPQRWKSLRPKICSARSA